MLLDYSQPRIVSDLERERERERERDPLWLNLRMFVYVERGEKMVLNNSSEMHISFYYK